MKKGRKVGPVSDRPSASKAKTDRSETGPTASPRVVSIRNGHPRLHMPRAAVAKAIALLDAQFKMPIGDLAYLSLSRPRLDDLKSKIENRAPSNRDEWRASSSDASRAASTPQREKSEQSFSVLPAGELSLVFLTDPALAKIHSDFMNDPTATDVITFEGDPLSGLAGEICVSADTAARYVGLNSVAALERCDNVATLSARSLKRGYTQPQPARPLPLQNDFATELTLYVVHGWLHLVGYDDLQPAKKRRMRAAESRAMKLLAAHEAIPALRFK